MANQHYQNRGKRPQNNNRGQKVEEKKETNLQQIYAKIQSLKPTFAHSILRGFTKWMAQLDSNKQANVKKNLGTVDLESAANTIINLYLRVEVTKRGPDAEFNFGRANRFAETNGLFDKPKDKPLDPRILGQSLAKIAQLAKRKPGGDEHAEIIRAMLLDLDQKERDYFHNINAGMNFGDAISVLEAIAQDNDPKFAARCDGLLPQKEEE